MKRKVKCRSCGESFEALIEEENISWIQPAQGQYYHLDCYNALPPDKLKKMAKAKEIRENTPRKVKCRCCKQDFTIQPREEPGEKWVMPSQGQYYHKTCYDDWTKKKNDVHTQADEEMWLDAVWQYLKKNIKIIEGDDGDYFRIKNQWDAHIKKGYTPKGIYFSILYFYEIQKGDPAKSRGGIGIVPFIYNDATQYWIAREQRERGIVAAIERQVRESQSQEIIKFKALQQPKKKKTFNLEDI